MEETVHEVLWIFLWQVIEDVQFQGLGDLHFWGGYSKPTYSHCICILVHAPVFSLVCGSHSCYSLTKQLREEYWKWLSMKHLKSNIFTFFVRFLDKRLSTLSWRAAFLQTSLICLPNDSWESRWTPRSFTDDSGKISVSFRSIPCSKWQPICKSWNFPYYFNVGPM